MSQAKVSYYAKRAVEEEALAMEATNSFERKTYERIAELYWQRAENGNFDVFAAALSTMETPLRGLSSNGPENLHKGLDHAPSMPIAFGSRSGLSSPRATMSGSVKA